MFNQIKNTVKLNYKDIAENKINSIKVVKYLKEAKNMEGTFQLNAFYTLKLCRIVFTMFYEKYKNTPDKIHRIELVELTSIINAIIRPSCRNSGATDRIIKKIQLEHENLQKGIINYEIPDDLNAFDKSNPFFKLFSKHTKETYEELIYQEQLMTLINELFQLDDLGLSDIYRRYFESNKEDKINELKEKFKELYRQKYPMKQLKEFWVFLLTVAGYSFNKSHSISYALLSLITIYLKADKTLPYFIATCINQAKSDQKQTRLEKIEQLVLSCNNLGIKVSLPKINQYNKKSIPVKDKKEIVLSLDIIDGFGNSINKVLSKAPYFNTLDDFLIWSNKQIEEKKDEETGEKRVLKKINKTHYRKLVMMNYFSPVTNLSGNDLINYINNFEIVSEVSKYMKQLKKGYKTPLKKTRDEYEILINENPETMIAKVESHVKLIGYKSQLEPINDNIIEQEFELIQFPLTNPCNHYLDHIDAFKEHYEGIIYIKEFRYGQTKGRRWTIVDVLWDKFHCNYPETIFFSDHVNITINQVLKINIDTIFKKNTNEIQNINIKEYSILYKPVIKKASTKK